MNSFFVLLMEHVPSLKLKDKLDEWVIDGFLGSGGFMEAYKVHNLYIPLIPRTLEIVKFSSGMSEKEREERVDEARLEMKILGKMNHPNIVMLHSVYPHGERPYYVRDFYERTLKEIIQEIGKMNLEETLDFMKQALNGLDYIHEDRKLVHADIKPSNLVVNGKKLAIADYNAAALSIEKGEELDLSHSRKINDGKIRYSVAYASPEQKGEIVAPIDKRSDFYSLGLVFCEMLMGRLPEQGEKITDVRPDLPEWVDEFSRKLLRKQPNERYKNTINIQNSLGRLSYEKERADRIENDKLKEITDRTDYFFTLLKWTVLAGAGLVLFKDCLGK